MFQNLKRMLSKIQTQESDQKNISISASASDMEYTQTEESQENFGIIDSDDVSYLYYNPNTVGYPSEDDQLLTYQLICSHITGTSSEDQWSILDFGCARGDFGEYVINNLGTNNYIGIDSNQILIDAGKEIYNNKFELTCVNWFDMPSELMADWAVNINSNNIRYDTTSLSDFEYLKRTIRIMHQHATYGSIILLTSGIASYAYNDGLINWNPGDEFNWAQATFVQAVLDHTCSDNSFILIIYK